MQKKWKKKIIKKQQKEKKWDKFIFVENYGFS